jgi:hypothetical protein
MAQKSRYLKHFVVLMVIFEPESASQFSEGCYSVELGTKHAGSHFKAYINLVKY